MHGVLRRIENISITFMIKENQIINIIKKNSPNMLMKKSTAIVNTADDG